MTIYCKYSPLEILGGVSIDLLSMFLSPLKAQKKPNEYSIYYNIILIAKAQKQHINNEIGQHRKLNLCCHQNDHQNLLNIDQFGTKKRLQICNLSIDYLSLKTNLIHLFSSLEIHCFLISFEGDIHQIELFWKRTQHDGILYF